MINFDLLTTVEECDALIAVFQEKQSDSQYKEEGAKRSADNVLARKVKRDADLVSTQAEINSLQTVIDSLPEGDIKDEFVYEKTLEEHKLYRLQNSASVNLDSYFTKEAEKQNYNNEAAYFGSIINDIESRKTAIQNG